MSEFKAQILGIILVLSIFSFLNTNVSSFFTDIWNNITTQVEQVTNPVIP